MAREFRCVIQTVPVDGAIVREPFVGASKESARVRVREVAIERYGGREKVRMRWSGDATVVFVGREYVATVGIEPWELLQIIGQQTLDV